MTSDDSIPLASSADETLGVLARASASTRLAALDGATLLGERAMGRDMRIPGRVSAGGGCRLYAAADDTVALNLARPVDREMLPALFQAEDVDGDDAAIAARIAHHRAAPLVAHGRTLGLALAAEQEMGQRAPASACVVLAAGPPAPDLRRDRPRVVDLTALWAGPLAGHLLWLAGAEVVKVESRTRPDALRTGDPCFYALLNQGKQSIALDLAEAADRGALLALIGASDIVLEAARPRALEQLGIDAAALVRATPGLVWISITAHGAEGEAADWVGFGDDCGVAGGLSAALRAACGRTGFVGDAIADPLTGIQAASSAWTAWAARRGARLGVAMSQVVAGALATARARDAAALERSLRDWSGAEGRPFPKVRRRPIGTLAAFGEHTRSWRP